MNAERWKQIDELFDAVLEIPNERREGFLSEKCKGDDELKREVLSLLDAQKETVRFMENSAMNLMAKELAQEHTDFFSFVGKEFGTYKIEKPIGAGGMGEVYLAHDHKLNRKVSLKILPAEFVAEPERIKRFEREARMISALNHPYIVTIFDVGSADGVNFIATEFVEGETVRELVNRGVDLKKTLSIISQTCEALSAAHKAGIVHRDIKPENIMVRPDGFVKVLDFGLAKLAEHTEFQQSLTNYTMKGVIIGTPAYMSPAQVSDDKVDQRTDLWSTGVVLYEMLTGVNPFKGDSKQSTFQKILSEQPPLVSESNPNLPAELDQILSKVLEKDPEVSHQTASDLRADLRRVRREIDSSPSLRTASGMRKSAEEKARTNYTYFAAGAFALILIGLSGWFFIKQSNTRPASEAVVWEQAKHVPLTDSSEVKGYPSLSPDGKSFIYTTGNDEAYDIFLQRIGGKNPTNLTANSPAADWMAAFSPNGKLIAFRSERQPGGIYVMEETGENVRRISDTGFHPSWSPDGKQIVVSDKSSDVSTSHTIPNSSLWTIDVETGNKKLLETKGDAIQPNWSPNGKRIVYWFLDEKNQAEIATIPATGGEPFVITRDSAMDWNPIWSPDGKFIYFASDRGGSMNIWRLAIDEETGEVSGEPESVTTPSMYVRHLAFSRDGKTLAYIRYETHSNLQSIAFDPEKLETVGEVNMVTSGNKQLSMPAMSPNGEEYVMRSFPTLTTEEIAVFSRDGSNLRLLTNDKFRDRSPRWSPDGKQIAFTSDRSGKYQVWMINADGTDLRQITFSEKTGAVSPIFSPDGSRLAFSEIDGKNQSPFVLDLAKMWQQQTPAPLPPIPNYKGSYSVRDWSGDGSKVLVMLYETAIGEDGIVVFDFKTSTYEKLVDSGSYPIWLKDNRHFIFDRQKTIYICDTQTKKINAIYKPPSYTVQHANISPDNRLLYFRYLQVDANVWLLDASQNQ